MNPPVTPAEGTNTGWYSACDVALQRTALRIGDLNLQDTMISAPISTCLGFENSTLSSRSIGLMSSAVDDLRAHSSNDASLFDVPFNDLTVHR